MKVVDLFAGCGGLSSGFINAGFNVVAAVEKWDVAVSCYRENFHHKIHQLDLSNIEEAVSIIQLYEPDVIIGGPPCQDFSHAGKRVEGEKANLTVDFAKIIEKIRPVWFVMENVDRIRNSTSYNLARKIFKTSDYGLTEIVLDASYCGVPQRRKRFFSIGHIHDDDNFLSGIIMDKIAQKPMTVREYFGDDLSIDYYYRHPRNYNRRGIFSVDEPAPTIRGVNRPIPKGYFGHKNDPIPVTDNVRSLSTYERSRIQTFPKDFKWDGTKTNIEQLIGNAVPVKLAEFVAKCVIQYSMEIKNDKSK